MESKVFIKMVCVEDDTFCFCDKDTFKICKKRLRDNLNCVESIIRITELFDVSECKVDINEIPLGSSGGGFLDTLKHVRIFNK